MENSNENGTTVFYKILTAVSMTAVLMLTISLFALVANLKDNEETIGKELVKIEKR